MSNITVLIDPNDNNLENLINEVNSLKPENVWVGCSTSKGEDIVNVFEKLKVPADLFPGNFDQIKKGHFFSKNVYVPNPLFYSNPKITILYSDILEYAYFKFPDKFQIMNYVVLHTNCTAAKILGVSRIFSDLEVIKCLDVTKVHETIYLEGGSRNICSSIVKRTELISEIKKTYPKSKVICGGGINQLNQAESLKQSGVDVVVSNVIHSNPKVLEQYMKIFE